MTTPTQAQIEAAAKAMTECMFAPHELPIEGELWDKYLWTAKAALTAAAGVEDKEKTIGWSMEVTRMQKNATIERCAQELEAAYAECDTLNLLHGAARLRALKDKPEEK